MLTSAEIREREEKWRETARLNGRLIDENTILKKQVDMDLIKRRYYTLLDVPQNATYCGVCSDFIELKDAQNPKFNGLYYVVTPDCDPMSV